VVLGTKPAALGGTVDDEALDGSRSWVRGRRGRQLPMSPPSRRRWTPPASRRRPGPDGAADPRPGSGKRAAGSWPALRVERGRESNLAGDTLAEVSAAAERGMQSPPGDPLVGVLVPATLRPGPVV